MSTGINYRVPSESEVRAALARLGKLPLRQAFYSKLENPHWVAALAKQGAFFNPPKTEVTPDGLVRSDFWPEIDYLRRMAPLVSKDVTDVLVQIAQSDNQWVRRGIMEAAGDLAPDDLARLAPIIKDWPGDERANFRIDPNHVTRAIVRLLENGQYRQGVRLAYAFFEPRLSVVAAGLDRTEPVGGLEEYWYAQCLPLVARALGTSRLPTLVRWLRKYLELAAPATSRPRFDPSSIWRPSIREAEEYHVHEILGSLIDATREVNRTGFSRDSFV